MIRRAVVLGTVLAALGAPSAHADLMTVNATATATPAAGGQVALTVSCQGAAPLPYAFQLGYALWRCRVGPVNGTPVHCGVECIGPVAAAGAGLAPAGDHELCVAVSDRLGRTFAGCVPLDPQTGTAVITKLPSV